ncbi:hypothetical protein BGZ65_002909 [Modicella reniformis]|uniref:Uncharacterized protein n=1 Tax=Modicella reniformis TaxID=1440133 RepID=A0A9P6MBL7_9FUNG|nr:hypothetical protein BGZ65_002909 [Modicella reniformis]
MTSSGYSPISVLNNQGQKLDAFVPSHQVQQQQPGEWKTVANLPSPRKRSWDYMTECINCAPSPVPGLEDLWRTSPNSVVSGCRYEELTDDFHKDIERDLSLHPQTLLAICRYFAGSILLNTKSGQAVVVNTVEGYARTRWLDVHCESFGSNKGKATMTSVPGLIHKDRYKGVRPITMGAYDGQRLVIGTAVADLLVTSSVRLDLRDAGCGGGVFIGGTTTTFLVSNTMDSHDIRIFLNRESIVAGDRISQEDNPENWCVDSIGIVYQLRQLKTKFHEPSTYLFSRASGPLTNMHPCMPYTIYTIYTIFDKMKSDDGCGHAGAGLFRLIGEKMVLYGAKKIAKPTLSVAHVREFRKRCKEGTGTASLFDQLLEMFSIRDGEDDIEIFYNDSLNDVLEKIADLLAPTITASNKVAAQYVTQQALRGL